jgi:hypothetical protein
MSQSRKKSNSLPDAEVLYDLWIYKRLSLRRIGDLYGWSRTAVHKAIRDKYGASATDRKKQSLARVIAEEYGDIETVKKTLNIEGSYYTTKMENNQTSHYASDSLLQLQCMVTPDEEEYSQPFRLCLFKRFTDILVLILLNVGYAR